MDETFVFKDPLWFAVGLGVLSVFLLRCFKPERVWIVPFAARWQSTTRSRTVEVAAVVVMLIGFGLLTAALARPQARTERTEFGLEAYDVMLAVDVSRSMLSEDYELDGRTVNRLEVLKPIVARFVTSRPRDRIGIVVFSGSAFTLMPPTWNHARLLWAFARLDISRFPLGTAIGDGLALAMQNLASLRAASTERVRPGFAVLMSDGSNNSGLFSVDEAVALAKARDTPVYSIAVGTGEFNSIPYFDEHGEKQFEIDRAEIDEGKLWTIAHETGGRFFRATNAPAIHASFDAISRRESLNVPRRKVLRAEELFFWFAVPGLALVLLATTLVQVSSAQWERLTQGATIAARTAQAALSPRNKIRVGSLMRK